MAKLDRYIGTQVFFAILAVLGIILGLALLFAFIDELGDLNKGDYGLGQALCHALVLPSAGPKRPDLISPPRRLRRSPRRLCGMFFS